MNHAHDPFVRNFIAEVKNARDLIRSSFPEELVSILSLDQLELTKDSFLSKKLKESRSDLLFKVPLKNSDSYVYIYILFEHKSYHDKKIYTQLLGYLSKIYSKQMKNKEKVSIVIPFVFYHGKKGWDLGLEFLDSFQKTHIPDVLVKYIPNFSIQLLELKSEGNEFETENIALKLYMRIIQIIRDKPDLFKKNLKKIYGSLREEKEIANQTEIFETIIEYIHLARKDAEEFTNKEILNEFEENYMNILERKKLEGIQIGMEKGEFQKAIQTARKMRDLGLAIDIIEKSVGLTERELKENGF